MKKALLFSAMAGFCCIAFAGAPPTPAPENTTVPTKQWLFKPLSSNDVSLEVERIDANVMVYLFSQNMRKVDVIYVEKSKDPTSGFTRCKTIKVADLLVKSKNYINVVDDNPLSANNDCYYRIRTVTAEGATKIYPPVVLSPIISIESETVDNK